jgi:outer membrane protein TolC
VAHHGGDASGVIAAKGIVLDVHTVLRLARESNPRIVLARERVNESQAAFDAAIHSCLPEVLRKDPYKRANAEAQLWERRAELRRVENEVLKKAADTYFDWLTAIRGGAIGHELEKYEEKLLKREQDLAKGESPAQVLVETTQLALNGLRQFLAKVRQQSDSATAKLAYLLNTNDSLLSPADNTLIPIDLVDAGVPTDLLVRQAQEDGPGVRELQGLIAAIQSGIDAARCARILCDHTGAAIPCGRLNVAQSQLRQAQASLVDLHGKLRLGVLDARSSILDGREQVKQATQGIQHAAETYRLMNMRLESETLQERLQRKTHSEVLTSIQQLSSAHERYLSAVNAYNKAQVRLLLLLGTHGDLCSPLGSIHEGNGEKDAAPQLRERGE